MVSWLFVILGFAVAWNYTDLESQNVLQSLYSPIFIAFFIIAAIVKLVVLLGSDKIRNVFFKELDGEGSEG